MWINEGKMRHAETWRWNDDVAVAVNRKRVSLTLERKDVKLMRGANFFPRLKRM